MRALIAVLVVLLVVVQSRLWFGPGGRRDAGALERKVAEQQAALEELAARNESLAAEVKDLKQGSSAIEGIARNELGMIEKGESFVQVFEIDDGPAAVRANEGQPRPEQRGIRP